ncbi:MAG: TIGR04076 family protein [Candidatus Heimdallarchaeota archaeon]|nr:TIGR04076 family protein [Candidatus Heimdallarchaeota archaeon]
MDKNSNEKQQFDLYNLEVIVEEINGNCTCSMKIGDKFFFKGGKISLPKNQDFCLYAIQSALPLLPAKQRKNHPYDWMETDSRVICPDPACQLIMRIDRVGEQTFIHDDVSATKI